METLCSVGGGTAPNTILHALVVVEGTVKRQEVDGCMMYSQHVMWNTLLKYWDDIC